MSSTPLTEKLTGQWKLRSCTAQATSDSTAQQPNDPKPINTEGYITYVPGWASAYLEIRTPEELGISGHSDDSQSTETTRQVYAFSDRFEISPEAGTDAWEHIMDNYNTPSPEPNIVLKFQCFEEDEKVLVFRSSENGSIVGRKCILEARFRKLSPNYFVRPPGPPPGYTIN